MKTKKLLILFLFNSFLIGYGVIIAGFIGTTFLTNNVDNIQIESDQRYVKDVQTVPLKAMPYAVLLFTDNNVPKFVLSNIKVEMKDIKTLISVPVTNEQILSGFSGTEHYNQIATAKLPENGIYLISITFLYEREDLNLYNPRIIFREGDMFQRPVIVYIVYLIFAVPLVNYVILCIR